MDVDPPAATDAPAADTDSAPAPRERQRLQQLRQAYLAAVAFNLQLRAEKAENERLIAQLQELVASTNPGYGGPPTPFSPLAGANDTRDAAAFVASQLGGIKALVADVKPKYAALLEDVRGTGGAAADLAGPEAERLEYIEKMTRRHMEVVRKLRLNPRGDVVNGDFEGGVRKDSEEVQRVDEIAGKMARRGR